MARVRLLLGVAMVFLAGCGAIDLPKPSPESVLPKIGRLTDVVEWSTAGTSNAALGAASDFHRDVYQILAADNRADIAVPAIVGAASQRQFRGTYLFRLAGPCTLDAVTQLLGPTTKTRDDPRTGATWHAYGGYQFGVDPRNGELRFLELDFGELTRPAAS